ncbi:MAG: hypothetical protein HN712_05400, partial [Gemmatimonadetes bacterium]|nr:hypothetical protein [Gemmatimonadota bacterium]
MSRYAAVILLLATLASGTQADSATEVEQPVEGFARGISADRQAPYWSNRGYEVISSYEYARDGTQSVVWESAAVPTEYVEGFVTFVWSCGMARQEDTHHLYLNDEMVLDFNTGVITEPTSWERRDVSLDFLPIMKDGNGEVHGVMYLRVPAARVTPGEPVRIKVRGSEGDGSWFMLHHFDDTYAKATLLELPTGRRMVVAPTRSAYRAAGRISWHGFLTLGEEDNLPAETVQLQARLKTNTDELTLEQEIHIEPDQRHVKLTLWSGAQVPAGEWPVDLTFSQDGVALQSWQGRISIVDLHELDIRADWPAGSLAGSLGPALKVAGIDWSRDYVRGFLGSAFSFSMKKDGKLLWQDSRDEQFLSPQVTEYLDHTTIDVTRFESKSAAEAEAWDKVRGAIDEGYPAVVRMR